MSFHGILNDVTLPEVLQVVSLVKRSGLLSLVCQEGTGEILLNSGRVVYCRSDCCQRLGSFLVRQRRITIRDLRDALREQKRLPERKPIGLVLLELGKIDRRELEDGIRAHMMSVLREILTWKSGFFQFFPDAGPDSAFLLSDGVQVEILLLENSRLDDECDRPILEEAVVA